MKKQLVILIIFSLFAIINCKQRKNINIINNEPDSKQITEDEIKNVIYLIEHENNGLLFESENHHDLAEKIMFLYNNREEMKRLAQNGYEYVQDFDISTMCEKYWDVYKSLIR